MKWIRVRNADKLTQYKDRGIKWVRVDLSLLHDYHFTKLPDKARGHILMIWLLAADNNWTIPYDLKWIEKQISADTPIDFDTLTHYFEVVDDDGNPVETTEPTEPAENAAETMPTNFNGWATALNAPKANQVDILRRMVYELTGKSYSYGRVGALLKRSGDPGYLAKLIWDKSTTPTAGNFINYLDAIIKKRPPEPKAPENFEDVTRTYMGVALNISNYEAARKLHAMGRTVVDFEAWLDEAGYGVEDAEKVWTMANRKTEGQKAVDTFLEPITQAGEVEE